MKKVLGILFAIILTLGIGYQYLYSIRPCTKPLRYSVGEFSTDFGITKSEFVTSLLKAERVWEDASGKDLFSYDPESEFKVNLIYDDRQQVTEQKRRAEYGLTEVENSFKKLEADLAVVKNIYEEESRVYEAKATAFQADKAVYEREVAFWNSRGGANEQKYNELTETASILKSRALELDLLALRLNDSVKELNDLVERRNIGARQYNEVLKGYSQKFGHGLEFDQAEYTGGSINIYQFNQSRDLLLALVHEFGHALGMEHVDSEDSIMYYLTNENSNQDIKPGEDDLSELKRVCALE
jgi:hypothetical protein